MADINEVTVNEDGTVVEGSGEHLTFAEKAFLGATAIGIGTAGYFIGTRLVAPMIRKVRSGGETEYDRAKRDAKRKSRRRSRSGVDYDEDAEFRDAEEDTED